jgi:hypothetical protein
MDSSKNYSIKYDRFLKWRTSGLRNEDGIVVGADISQEWLLPWWWKNYRKHNSNPVAFVDFGMSFEKKDWCRERGELIPLRIFDDFVTERADVEPEAIQYWEGDLGKAFWSFRSAWFKKPLACLQSPFRRSIWIDLDCEIRGSLLKLFDYADTPQGLGMVRDFGSILSDLNYTIYNSGVISFRRNHPLISDWARNCMERNCDFKGDQEVFSYLIAEKKIDISQVDQRYNWSRLQEETGEEIILHWHGIHGKNVIQSQINLEELCY